MAGKREVKVVFSGDASGAQSAANRSAAAFGKIESTGTRVSRSIGSAFGRMGNVLGGEVGAVLSQLSTNFDDLGEHGTSFGKKLMVAGGAATGLGMALTMMGSKEKQSSDQLKQAIEATGNSMDEFEGRINSTVHHMEKFGYTAVQTKDALTTLTNATHDPAKALDLMGEAADYAAVKHISLNDAATALARGINGSAKMFKQFGIEIKKNADGTKDYAGANERLAQILHGQAAAAADNFGGRLRHLRAEVEDQVAAFGQKYGPAITALGPVMMATGAAMQFFQNRAATAAASAAASEAVLGATSATTATEMAASNAEMASSTEASSAAIVESNTASAGSFKRLIGSIGPMAGALAGAATGFILWKQELAGAKDQVDQFGGAFAKGGLALDAFVPGVTILGDKFAKLVGIGPGSSRAIDGVGHSSDIGRIALRGLTGATQENSKALKAVAYDANATNNAFTRLNAKYLDAEEASLSFKDAEAQMGQALKDNGHSLDDNSVKGRANKEAIFQAIHAAQSHADAVWKQTHSVEASTKAFQGDRAELRNTLVQMGFNRAEVNRLISAYMHIPAHRKTQIDLNADKARHDAQTLLDIINAIPSEKYTNLITVVNKRNANPDMNPGRRNAVGASSFSGSTTLNEEGQEIVRLPDGSFDIPTGSRIYTHAQAQQMTSAQGGDQVIQVNLNLDGHVIHTALLRVKRERGASLGLG